MNILTKIYRRARKYSHLLVISIVSMLVATSLNLISPMLVRQLLKLLGEGGDVFDQIIILGLILLGAYGLRVVFRLMYSYLAHKAAWSYVRDLRIEMYDHLQSLSMGYYSDKQTGQLMSRVITDTHNFEVLIAHAVPDTLANVVTFAAVAAVLFTLNPMLALLTCIPLPLVAIAGMFFAKVLRPNFRKAQKYIGDVSANLQDNLSGMKEIQIFNRQEWGHDMIATATNNHRDAILKALKASAIFHPSVELITSLGSVIIIIFGGYMSLHHGFDPADVVTFLLYIGMFYAPISTLSRVVEDYQNALAGGERVFELLDTVSAVKDAHGATPLPSTGDIEFENVSFDYGNGQEVLRGVSFTAQQGKTLAIVGPTGVGKTTIINLLMRFYDPVEGRVLIDGHDIKAHTQASLRSSTSIVLQDTFLFNGTIAQNIAFAKPNATEDEIINAAKQARIHEDILLMPAGYQTIVGERGMRLSGGQKQRVSIARAILRNSPILILDEATASVDVETEQKIQQALNELSQGRTIIVIAHRLSTIRRADKIIVLENGQISEQGTHSTLIKTGGLYSKLNFLQAAREGEGSGEGVGEGSGEGSSEA